MGNKWQGEELLKFYTFIVYNLGFIMSKNARDDSHSESESEADLREAAELKYQDISLRDNVLGKRSTGKNPDKRKPLSNLFYKDLLDYLTDTLGNPNKREISHLRCKMSKFFAKREHNGIESIKLRWKNGMILYEDLYSIYVTNPDILLVSSDCDSVKTPYMNEENIIQNQLNQLFGLSLTTKERFILDHKLLMSIDWPEYCTEVLKSLPEYIKEIRKQIDLFERKDSLIDDNYLEDGHLFL
jgi:hypothetical protein